MLLLIDGNNLAWAGFYALERAMKPENEERRLRVAVLGLASGILGAIARAGEPPGAETSGTLTRVVICFDEGRPLRRRKFYPPYQTAREHDPKFVANEPTILTAIAEFVNDAAPSLPVEVLRAPNTEADDLIAGTVHANARVHRRIVSTDRDFLQLIGPKISVYAPVKKLVIDDANFAECVTPKDAAGHLSPAVYLDYRALIGDPSDTLPGVPGVGSLSAVKLLVSAPLDSYDGEPAAVRAALGRKSEAVERAFADGSAAEIIARNRTLMDLRLPAPCWDELDALTTRGAWDRSRFEAWLEEQRFSGVDQPALLARLESLAATTAKTNR